MKTYLLLDTETTGTDAATDVVIEIAGLLWSGAEYASCSTLLRAEVNPAEAVNRIPPAALRTIPISVSDDALRLIEAMGAHADVVLAHNAPFDERFVRARWPEWPTGQGRSKPWVDTMDLDWPRVEMGYGLVDLALAHGVAVASAHRALTDCRLLAKLLDRLVAKRVDIDALVQRASEKITVIGRQKFADNEQAKRAGFRWRPELSQWIGRVHPDRIAVLPFDVEVPS